MWHQKEKEQENISKRMGTRKDSFEGSNKNNKKPKRTEIFLKYDIVKKLEELKK